MIRVMFVCHGNICRSPMAEMILKSLLRARGTDGAVTVSSCATSTEEIWNGRGNPVYPPARAELAKHGIPCGDHHAVQLTKADYADCDLLIGMDSANLRNMQRITGGDPLHKMHLLGEYAGTGRDIADPWYSGRFDLAYADICAGCEGLLAVLEQEGFL